MVSPDRGSAEELVEIVVGTDPHPDDRIAVPLPDRPILLADTNGPDMVIAAQPLEPQ